MEAQPHTYPAFHPLATSLEPPTRFNNPFCYEPHALCQLAIDRLAACLRNDVGQDFLPGGLAEPFRRELLQGKMLGVLVVECDGRLGYLAGYSGQVCGRSDWPGFVPAVFDYLQPQGYFKTHEAAITALNHRIADLERGEPLAVAHRRLEEEQAGAQQAVEAFKTAHPGTRLDGETDDDYVRRRQFENAELHRLKVARRKRVQEALGAVDGLENAVRQLRRQRRQMSDSLQAWLFAQFRVSNALGETANVAQVFSRFAQWQGSATMVPPAGTGECCEPKLLQYAYSHGMRPRCMTMFWWGKSPNNEVRHHLQAYPACNGKCKPLLWWMLQGLDVEPNALHADNRLDLPVVYDDDDLCVVCKPAGMLSVPGKSGRESVQSLVRARYPEARGPLIVHRLDMATSGLMVVAKTWQAYHDLQGQFARHEVKKRYVARLSRPLDHDEGWVTLPLRPDLTDRPRQVIDREHGRKAVTHYQKLNGRMVALYPLTGRTHQLRLHCAHHKGLDNPIEGDALYGTPGLRLCLHAESLTFRHPRTGKWLTFESKAPFAQQQ